MEAAFERLTIVQQRNINKHMFVVAYNCVIRSQHNQDLLNSIIRKETENCPHLEADLIRYCKLVERVM